MNAVVVTPPILAKRWGISADKVRRWIESGELLAANFGDGIRPRYRINEQDAMTFWEGRQNRKRQALDRRRQSAMQATREYI